jgi:hypothetical protein
MERKPELLKEVSNLSQQSSTTSSSSSQRWAENVLRHRLATEGDDHRFRRGMGGHILREACWRIKRIENNLSRRSSRLCLVFVAEWVATSCVRTWPGTTKAISNHMSPKQWQFLQPSHRLLDISQEAKMKTQRGGNSDWWKLNSGDRADLPTQASRMLRRSHHLCHTTARQILRL